MNFSTSIKKFSLVLLLLSVQGFAAINLEYTAKNKAFQNSNSLKMQSLKAAIEEVKLLPTLNEGAMYGASVDVEGDRAVVGAPNENGTGAVYVYDYDGTNWIETTVLTPQGGATGEQFGYSVSLSGDRIAVGAYLYNDVASAAISGSVYVFDLVGASWSQSSQILASNRSLGDKFGFSISLDGDRLLVGAHTTGGNGTNSGSAYVFDLVSNVWTETQILTSTDAAAGDLFGFSVSLNSNSAVIGAIGNDDSGQSSGSIYIFEYTASWNEVVKLVASDASAGDLFGYSLSSTSTTVLVGAPNDSDSFNNAGAAYVFNKTGGIWSQSNKIVSADLGSQDGFGTAVSLNSNMALISAFREDANGQFNSGAVYLFDQVNNSSWSQIAKITAADANEGVEFGNFVALNNTRLIVGNKNDNDNGEFSGSAYVYDLVGGFWVQQSKLKALNGALNDRFGYSVSISNDIAVVGSYFDDSAGSNSGAAYIYEYSGGMWHQTAKLMADDAVFNAQFGFAVSIEGNRVAIAANRDPNSGLSSGAVYIFEKSMSWTQKQKLTAIDSTTNDNFGYSVSLSGNRILISAPFDDDNGSNSGSVYIFDLVNNVWTQSSKHTATDTTFLYGESVSLLGDRFIVGSRTNNSSKGAVYVYDWNGVIWMPTTTLLASDGSNSDSFGISVSLSTDRILVGANGNDDSGSSSGSAYVFEVTGGVWTETEKITASDAQTGDNFGYSVSLNGNRMVIGAYKDDDNGVDSGSVYQFDYNGSTWIEKNKLIASDGQLGETFGQSVDLSAGKVIVGAYADDLGVKSGAAYIVALDTVYTISGSVSGIALGNSIELENNLIDTITVGNGAFSFPIALNDLDLYDVKIKTLPTTPSQSCTLTGGENNDGTGTINGANVNDIMVNCTVDQFNVGVNVTGLENGNSVTFRNNGSDDLVVSNNGVDTNFSMPIDDSTAYAITVFSQPTNPAQDCVVDVNNASGILDASDVIVSVVCTPTEFLIGVTVNGLAPNNAVVLQNNNSNDLVVSSNNSLTYFSGYVALGSTYAISVLTNPTTPNQSCIVDGFPTGTVVGNINYITVNCTVIAYNVGVILTGLAPNSQATFRLESGGIMNVQDNGILHNFPQQVDDETSYNVSIFRNPSSPTQICSFDTANNTGVIAGADVVINITCTTNSYNIGFIVNGLTPGNSVVFDQNGARVSVPNNGVLVNFAVPFLSGSAYSVSVFTQPTSPNQTCLFETNAAIGGTIINSDLVFNVTCTTNLYPLEFAVSGLANNNTVTIENNHGEQLIGSSNATTYIFPTRYNSLEAYSLSVVSQPVTPNQICTANNPALESGNFDGSLIIVGYHCTTVQYNVGVKVFNLESGNSIEFKNNNNETVTVTSNNNVTNFASPLFDGSSYNVSISMVPTNPLQSCSFINNDETGVISASDKVVEVNCTQISSYDLNINLTGLASTNTVSFANNGDTLTANTNGVYTLSTLDVGTSFNVSITSQPNTPSQICSFNPTGSEIGMIINSAITLNVACVTNQYFIAGMTSGLISGNSLILRQNLENLVVNNNGAFVFANPVDDGTNYQVTITRNPESPIQVCAVQNGVGTIDANDVSNIGVICQPSAEVIFKNGFE